MIDKNYLSKVLLNKRSGRNVPRLIGVDRKNKSSCEVCGKEDLSKCYLYKTEDGKILKVGSKCSDKLKSYYSNYESVFDDLIEKHPDLKEAIQFLKDRDPSGSLKYLRWEVKVLVARKALENEIADVIDLFHRYSSNLEKKDINSYSVDEFTSLRDRLFSIKEQREAKKAAAKEKFKLPTEEGAEVIYDGDVFSVVLIKNKQASSSFGRGTKWCITMGMANYWEDYEGRNNVFFFIIDKKTVSMFEGKSLKDNPPPDLYKIAAQFERNSRNEIDEITFWDSKDNIRKYVDVEKYVGEEFEPMVSVMAKVAKSRPQPFAYKIRAGTATADEVDNYFFDAVSIKDFDKKYNMIRVISEYKNTSKKTQLRIFKNSIKDLKKVEKEYEFLKKISDSDFYERDSIWQKFAKESNALVSADLDYHSAVDKASTYKKDLVQIISNSIKSEKIDKYAMDIIVGIDPSIDYILSKESNSISRNAVKELLESHDDRIKRNIATSVNDKELVKSFCNDKNDLVRCAALSREIAPEDELNRKVKAARGLLFTGSEDPVIRDAICAITGAGYKKINTKYLLDVVDSCLRNDMRQEFKESELCKPALEAVLTKANYGDDKTRSKVKEKIDVIIKSNSESNKNFLIRSLKNFSTDMGFNAWNRLKEDDSENVRVNVASTGNAPLFMSMLNDNSDDVKSALSLRWNFSKIVDENGNEYVNSWGKPNEERVKAVDLATTAMEKLSDEKNDSIKINVAEKFLYGMSSNFNEERVIGILTKLSNDESETVAKVAQRALSKVKETLSSATKDSSEEEKREAELRKMVERIKGSE